jgi:hypothetical protein
MQNRTLITLARTVGIGVASMGLLLATSASANTITVSGSVGGAELGVSHVNFDNLATGQSGALTGTGPGGSVSLQLDPDAQTLVGALVDVAAAPWLSGANGSGFGSQLPGADQTTYLTSGKTPNSGKITMSFASAQNYLGLLWGSVDAYNTVEFYIGVTSLGTVTGLDVLAAPNGDQGINGTLYVNMISGTAFDTVVFTSSSYAFEIDNVAYGTVPDGGLTATLLGMGMLGLGYVRRTVK